MPLLTMMNFLKKPDEIYLVSRRNTHYAGPNAELRPYTVFYDYPKAKQFMLARVQEEIEKGHENRWYIDRMRIEDA